MREGNLGILSKTNWDFLWSTKWNLSKFPRPSGREEKKNEKERLIIGFPWNSSGRDVKGNECQMFEMFDNFQRKTRRKTNRQKPFKLRTFLIKRRWSFVVKRLNDLCISILLINEFFNVIHLVDPFNRMTGFASVLRCVCHAIIKTHFSSPCRLVVNALTFVLKSIY